MKGLLSIAFSLIFVMFFSSASLAAPTLHSPQPSNNTFIAGGPQMFAINITSSNLNSSSALLYIISLNAYQQGENWDVHALTCVNTSSEWKCNKAISFAIAGSDTVELFYFEANDTDNTKGNNGTAGNPLRFTLDRNPPLTIFVNPTNNSYVKGNQTISVTVTDSSSGVNNSAVQYSTDGSSWTSLNNVSATSFEATWNTTTFSNNQTVTLSIRTSDNVRNNATTRINVTVDNEIPQLTVLSSLTGVLGGGVQLQINANDSFSGVNLGNVRYKVGSLTGTLGCTGSNYSATCSAVLNTANLQDGNHTLDFTVTDNAGNSNTSLVNITTKNTQPIPSILEPSNNAFVKGTILIRASIANAEGTTYATVSIEQGANTTTKNMTCNSGFTSCNYSLNTTSFADGGYTVKVNAMNNSGVVASSSIIITIDNTKPSVTILQPIGDVKGDFEIKVDIIDTNFNQNKASFNISSFNGSLTCTPQTPTKYICSTSFNSKQLNDGKYSLDVIAEDKADNIIVTTKEISITNNQAGGIFPQTGGTPEEVDETKTKEEGKKPLINVTLLFESKYIILGVVIVTAIVILIILALVARQRMGKTIITD